VSRGDPAALAAIDALRRDYASSLAWRVGELSQVVRSARAAPDDPRRSALAWETAHRLRGTIGSFGFVELSEIIGAVEREIGAGAARQGAPAWGRVEALLGEASACAARLCREVAA
jgi:hypothetical protein